MPTPAFEARELTGMITQRQWGSSLGSVNGWTPAKLLEAHVT